MGKYIKINKCSQESEKSILTYLDHREDKALSTLASKRDIKNEKRIKHKDAWKILIKHKK